MHQNLCGCIAIILFLVGRGSPGAEEDTTQYITTA